MPAPADTTDTRNPSLLTVLFWVGVALAPVAALILLVADGNGPLRFAAVLAILAVVLIGLSIALRADGGTASEELREEIEELRRELRGEIVATAQRGNQALDQAHRAQEAVGALRRRLDAGTAALAGPADVGSAGRARVGAADEPAEDPRWGGSEGDDEGTAWRADPHPNDRLATGSAGVYGGDRPATGSAGVYGGDRPAPGVYGGGDRSAGGTYGGGDRSSGGTYGGGDRSSGGIYGGADRSSGGTYGGGDHAPGGTYGGERSGGTYGGERSGTGYGAERAGYGPWPADDAQPGHRPMGVVRHTETVHVTTRHTIVDGGGPVLGETGTRYGGYAGRWSPGPEERPWTGDGEDRSWSGQPDTDDRSWSGRDERNRRDDRGWGERDEPARAGQQWDDRGWSEQRDDRGWGGEQSWDTSAEAYGRGRSSEPDGDGEDGEYWSQLRAGDRWAAVREDDRGREMRMGERRAEVLADQTGTEFRVADRWASVRRDEPGRDRADAWRGAWAEPEDRAALPAGGVPVPDEWRVPRQRQPEPERAPEPGRYGYPPRDDAPRAGGPRSTDRWR
ncbi:hypothetical protein [Micromonospora thermarum]|uniref:Uncharacterized protein n=1 Tax=Micromonospora thermarum TaxID=2720024 RepID=A0ABX0Z867_9ACTN|nr:hypothetical protein [Micromonospora thermarum]NJP34062.1 hypothetical protein [Micromonospora thermarum]